MKDEGSGTMVVITVQGMCYKPSVLRRQCSDTNQNIKKLVYCR